jgi:hypothetical protein
MKILREKMKLRGGSRHEKKRKEDKELENY